MRRNLDRWRHAATDFASTLRRHPDRIIAWLAGARAAQVAVLVLVPVVLFAVPPVLDRALEAHYSDVTVRGKFLGFLPTEKTVENPQIPERKRQLTILAWILASATVLALLGRRLPHVLREPGTAAPGSEATVVESPAAAAIATPGPAPARPGPGSDAPERYRIEELLARGGMGAVYRAHDTVLDRAVALKELPVDLAARSDGAERFTTEARALARLAHPNIVQVYDLMEASHRLWMAIELVEGGNLASLVEERGQVPPGLAARLARDVARGLEFAHSQGVIHRDIKPTNVLLDRHGTPKIADFGIAKLTDQGALTRDGAIVGSPHYMSPEQAAGRAVDQRSDVYSLGVLLYQMLTGERPFQGDVVSLISQHLSAEAPPVRFYTDEVPLELSDLVARMMAKDPAGRPSGMAAAARELEPWCGDDAPGRDG